MNKNITLMSSCLLLISTQIYADRPAMEDNPPESRPTAPVATTTQDISNRPEPEPASAVDLSIQQEQVTSIPQQQTGDVLEMQPGETLPVSALDFPRRGMSMDKVKNELGQPNVISDTIGDPPITSWTYADRIVYFEHSNVIHTVSNR